MGRLFVLSKHASDQRLEGLSVVGIDFPGSGWPLGGSKTQMKSSTYKDTPCQISGDFLFHLPLLELPFHFFFFLSFCRDFATASSSSSASATASSSASATASSLASTQYSIRTNYVTILIRSLGCKGMNVMMDSVWCN